MAFHENFQEEFIVYYTPKWFKLRSELYAEACEWKPRKPDEIFFHFKNLDAGWMDFDVYVNGEKKHECYFSAVFNHFHNITSVSLSIYTKTKNFAMMSFYL